MDKIEIFGKILIVALSCIELCCLYLLGSILITKLRTRSQERTDARREALRPPAYKKVRDSWAIYRNRRSLWASIKK